jgi:hypothetical protein
VSTPTRKGLPRRISTAARRRPRSGGGLTRNEGLILVAGLAVLVLLNVPVLGADPWPFRPDSLDPRGPLGSFADAAGEDWDPEAVRAPALLAGVLLALAGAIGSTLRVWRPWVAGALTAGVLALLLVPAVLLQAGLRQSSEPWFYTNDSTYQIELAGDLLREGEDPYGHDYRRSGLERFYSFDGSVTGETRNEQVALRHFAYFPGTALSAAAWTTLPEPWADYRFLVLLTTFAGFLAALLFRAPLLWRLLTGAVIAGSPLAVRAVWFGTADAPSIVFTVLAFALATRRRFAVGAASLAVAVLLKQFALVALPFYALLVFQHTDRRGLVRAAALFAALVLAGLLPFLAWDAGALWDDTIEYGGRTYRIVGYGLSGLLLKAGILDERTGPYPFLPLLLLVWLPVTAWLLWRQWRSAALWTAAAGFAVSIFLLVFLGRVFQGSYLTWPLVGVAVASLLAAAEGRQPPPGDGAGQRVPGARSQTVGVPRRT